MLIEVSGNSTSLDYSSTDLGLHSLYADQTDLNSEESVVSVVRQTTSLVDQRR